MSSEVAGVPLAGRRGPTGRGYPGESVTDRSAVRPRTRTRPRASRSGPGPAKSRLLAGTALALSLSMPAAALAATFDVANEAELRAAVFAANDMPGQDTITLTGSVTLTQSLPMITDDLVFEGGGLAIDGQDAHRVFFVQGGTVAISDVTVANAAAVGGDGG